MNPIIKKTIIKIDENLKPRETRYSEDKETLFISVQLYETMKVRGMYCD